MRWSFPLPIVLISVLCLTGCREPETPPPDSTAPVVYDLAERLPSARVETGWTHLDPGDATAAPWLGRGWGAPDEEFGGRWIADRSAALSFMAPQAADLRMRLHIRPHLRDYRAQSLRVALNGTEVQRLSLPRSKPGRTVCELRFPARLVQAGVNRVDLRFGYRSRGKQRAAAVESIDLQGLPPLAEPSLPVPEKEGGWQQAPGTTLTWPLVVPRRGFVSVQSGAAARTLRLWLRDGERRVLLGEATPGQALSERLSLVRYGGQRVQLACEVLGEAPARLGHVEPRDVNVHLLTIDTLRADRVGAYGGPKDLTPALDALAARGLLFEQAYAASNESMPSHASMFTGRYPQSHGLIWNGRQLNRQQTTLAQMLGQHGLRTACYVNWGPLALQKTTALGFTKRRVLPGTPSVFNMRDAGNNVFSGALKWVGAEWQARQFLWIQSQFLHMTSVPEALHRAAFRRLWPEDPDARFDELRARLDQGTTSSPTTSGIRTWSRLPADEQVFWIAFYEATVRYTDDHVGAYVEGLQRLNLDPFTALIVVSDHGTTLGERNHFSHLGPPFRHLMQVPLLFVLPGRPNTQGQRLSVVAETVDIAPTLLDYLGLDPPRRLQGRSLLDRSLDRPVDGDAAFCMVGRGNGHPYYAVGNADSWYWLNTDGRTHLAGPTDQPPDSRNRAEEFPELAAAWAERLGVWIRHTPDVSGSTSDEMDDEIRAMLRKSGYLENRE